MKSSEYGTFQLATQAYLTSAQDLMDEAQAVVQIQTMVQKLVHQDTTGQPPLGKCILLLDDEPMARTALARILSVGCKVPVHEAGTYLEADGLLEVYNPAVVVCDWALLQTTNNRLTMTSGLNYLRKLSHLQKGVLITGHPVLGDLRGECDALGIQCFVRPLTMTEAKGLNRHVRSLLKQSLPLIRNHKRETCPLF